jgi:hypothetical protein
MQSYSPAPGAPVLSTNLSIPWEIFRYFGFKVKRPYIFSVADQDDF